MKNRGSTIHTKFEANPCILRIPRYFWETNTQKRPPVKENNPSIMSGLPPATQPSIVGDTKDLRRSWKLKRRLR